MGASCCCGVESKDDAVTALLKAGAVIVDARPAAAFQKGHADGAVNIPVGSPMAGKAADAAVEAAKQNLPEDKDQPIVCHCAVGGEAMAAVKALKRAGFTNVINAGSLARVMKLKASATEEAAPAAAADTAGSS